MLYYIYMSIGAPETGNVMGARIFWYSGKGRGIFNVAFIALAMLAIFLLLAPQTVFAQPAKGELAEQAVSAQELGLYYGEATGLGTSDIRVIIVKIIRIGLGLLGIIALVIIIAGGVVWMTAGGSLDKIKIAKKILQNGVIGLAIILSAFAITQFIFSALLGGGAGGGGLFGGGAGGEGAGGDAARFNRYAGASHLGKVIQDHFPERGARNIPRNTQVIITFREPMKLDTLVKDTNGNGTFGDCVENRCDSINNEHVKISRTDEVEQGVSLDAVDAVVGGAGRTVTYIPREYLGTANEEVGYTVIFGGGIKKENDKPAFGGLKSSYTWVFVTGGQVDDTPPSVVRVSPSTDGGPDRVVQITFSEAMSPVGLEATTDANHFVRIYAPFVDGARNAEVKGVFRLVNGYKTAIFLPEQVCGQNACGDEKRCLPFNAATRVLLETAALLRDDRATGIPGSGLVDMSGNALDGGGENGSAKDGKANGQPLVAAGAFSPDNYWWQFRTSAQLDLTSPTLVSVSPLAKLDGDAKVQGGVPFEQPVEMLFSEEMSYGTIVDGMQFETSAGAPPIGFSSRMSEEDVGGGRLGTKVTIKPTLPLVEDMFYASRVPYTVFDAAQNCFYPAVGPGCDGSDPNNPSCCSYKRDVQGTRPGPAQGCGDVLAEE